MARKTDIAGLAGLAGITGMTGADNFPLLHLYAHGREDLPIMSACLQDAVLRSADMRWDSRAQLFVMLVNRFCWEQDTDKPMRRRCGVHIHHVRAIRSRAIRRGWHDRHDRHGRHDRHDRQDRQETLCLLALDYPDDKDGKTGKPSGDFAPIKNDDGDRAGGLLRFVFSGNAEILLTVEAVNVIMRDMAPGWTAKSRPVHKL